MHGGFNEDPKTGIVYTGIPGHGQCPVSSVQCLVSSAATVIVLCLRSCHSFNARHTTLYCTPAATAGSPPPPPPCSWCSWCCAAARQLPALGFGCGTARVRAEPQRAGVAETKRRNHTGCDYTHRPTPVLTPCCRHASGRCRNHTGRDYTHRPTPVLTPCCRHAGVLVCCHAMCGHRPVLAEPRPQNMDQAGRRRAPRGQRARSARWCSVLPPTHTHALVAIRGSNCYR